MIVDTWRWDALGANGAARPGLTPHLDRLASRGVRFTRAIASSSWTEPSVASMLTGVYPTVHGAHGVDKTNPVREGVAMLAELLSERGYRTVGVVNAFFMSPKLGFGRGFDVYDYVLSSNFELRSAAGSVDAALEHLRAEPSGAPVFLLLHVWDPHLAYDPPSPWREEWASGYEPPFADLQGMRSGTLDQSEEHLAFIRGLYDGEVAYVDRELGRLFEGLDTLLGDRERLVVVTGDHGEEFGEHGGWEHGHAMYRELVQVPLVLVPPASRRPSTGVVDAQVRLLDLMPTLLDAAGVEPPEGISGTSLFPWFGEARRTDDLPALSERVHLGPPSFALRDGKHVLIYRPRQGRSELYDQLLDPFETRDIGDVEPERAEALKRQLESLAEELRRRAEDLGRARREIELDAEEIERLKALGYLDGG